MNHLEVGIFQRVQDWHEWLQLHVQVAQFLADLRRKRVFLEVFGLEVLERLDCLVDFFWKCFTVKFSNLTIHPILDPVVVLRCELPKLIEWLKLFFDDFDSTKISLGLSK